MYLRSLKLCMIATTLSSILPCQFWVILIKAGHNNGRQMTKMEGTGFSRQVLIHNLCQAWCIHASSDDHQLFSVWQESLNNKKSLYIYLFFIVSHLNISSTSLDCCSMYMSMKMWSFLLLLKYCSAVCCLCLIQYVWHVNAHSVLLWMWFIYVCVLTSVRRRKH